MWPLIPLDAEWTEEAALTANPTSFFPRNPSNLTDVTSVSALAKVVHCFEKESHASVEMQRKAYDLFQEDEVLFKCKCIDLCSVCDFFPSATFLKLVTERP